MFAKPRRDYEIKKIGDMEPNLKNKLLAKISLSQSCKDVILGSILGDGSLKLYRPYKNARFWIRQSYTQIDYWLWKTQNLKEIQTECSRQIQPSNGYSNNKKLLFQSCACESLTQIYHHTYSQNRLNIKRCWLNHLKPLSLAIWWLDDGSIIGNGKRGVICTDSFSHKDHQVLKRYLAVVWKIEVNIGQLKRIYDGKVKYYFRLYLNNSALRKFFKLIMHYTPIPSMIYKYCLLYKDTELQERWISEMLIAFPDYEFEIRETIRSRKSKAKYFRK